MKKIEKEIKVVRYVAFDGTEFETERECEKYEGCEFCDLLKHIENDIIFTSNAPYFSPDGLVYNKWYGIIQRNRTDVRVLNDILSMAGEEPQANGNDEWKLLLLGVNLECNTVAGARLFKIDDFVRKISGNKFTTLCMIKEETKRAEK